MDAALSAATRIRTPSKRYLTEAERFESVRSMQRLKDEITKLASHLNAANHRFLILIAELDRRQGWSDGATQSCAHWLNWKCGLGMGAAREKVRVAHALQSLPKISAAMEKGELSYSKVRELTRVACDDTEGETARGDRRTGLEGASSRNGRNACSRRSSWNV